MVGDVLQVPFPRPRDRKAVLEHPAYYELREHLMTFLEVHAHRRPAKQLETDLPPGSGTSASPPSPEISKPVFQELVSTLERVCRGLSPQPKTHSNPFHLNYDSNQTTPSPRAPWCSPPQRQATVSTLRLPRLRHSRVSSMNGCARTSHI